MGHVTDLVLESVRFTVGELGRQRVIRERQKNVHAFACGVLVGQIAPELICPIDLAYDPYRFAHFVQRGTDRAIVQCRYLVVRQNWVTVSPDALNLTPLGGEEAILD